MFELVSGADTSVVRSGDLDGERYRISTPREAEGVPVVTERDEMVSTSLSGKASVEVLLSDDVRWTIRIAGGAVFGPAGWDTAAGRYDIQALAGVSGFTLDRR